MLQIEEHSVMKLVEIDTENYTNPPSFTYQQNNYDNSEHSSQKE